MNKYLVVYDDNVIQFLEANNICCMKQKIKFGSLYKYNEDIVSLICSKYDKKTFSVFDSLENNNLIMTF